MAILLSCFWAPSAEAGFGIASFSATARNQDGTLTELAGAHPYAYTIFLSLNRDAEGNPEGDLYSFSVDLPPGLVGNANAVPQCPLGDFEKPNTGFQPSCPGSTQIGVVHDETAELSARLSLYNLGPQPGDAALFGFGFEGSLFLEHLTLDSDGGATFVRVDNPVVPASFHLRSLTETIWGVPADPTHDSQRVCLDSEDNPAEGCPAEAEPAPLITMPVSCGEPLRTTAAVSSAQEPERLVTETDSALDESGQPLTMRDCEGLSFAPTFSIRPEGAALSPTGLQFHLHLPQDEAPDQRATAAPRELTFSLPEGLVLAPPAAAGLGSCSPAQIGLRSAPGEEPARFDAVASSCPDAAKIGRVSVSTPLLSRPLSGALYLATPNQNPSASDYAFYAVLEDEASATLIKLSGRLDADSLDGRLTAIVSNLPQLPFSDIEVELPGGPRAILRAPSSCGTYETSADLVSWGAPEAEAAQPVDSFTLSQGPAGGTCPPPEAERPNSPEFQAGSVHPVAGASTPFIVQLGREDTGQPLSFFDFTLPPGVVANLGSVLLGSVVGSAQVSAGVGPDPLSLEGTVHLDGPYKGAPYSLAVVVPAQAGPFDLGTITERIALDVDPRTAQVSARADPLPQILDGVPLELRTLGIDLDRAGFIRNPTSCEPMAIGGSATSSLGQTAPLSAHFQVGGCAKLAFRPKLSLRFSGALGRNGHPALRATLRTDPSGAALKSAAFALPAGELLDLQHVRELCPRGTPVGQCPRDSRLGTLRLQSPSLEAPLEGPVYLRVPTHRLPDLSAEMHSGGLSFVLRGRAIDSGGRLGVSLESLPDIPLSSAVLSLAGGRRGILVNSRSLCGGIGDVIVHFSAHSGKLRRLRVHPQLGGHC